MSIDNSQISLTIPEVDTEGRIPTLNKMGWVFPNLDPISQLFVNHAASIKSSVLEIAAGYGFATLAALEKGAKIIANDIDERHLFLLKEKVPKTLQNNLTLIPGAFPNLNGISNNSIGAILCVRVLHFFDCNTLENAMETMYDLLHSGGKVFIVTNTPYMKNWQKFIPVYEEKKRNGEPYPGFIEDIEIYNPEYVESTPRLLNLLDLEVMERLCNNTGFKVEKLEYMDRKDYPSFVRLDGKESLGLIAKKE